MQHHVLHLRDAQSHCSVRSAHRNSVTSLSSASSIPSSSTEPRTGSAEAVCKEIGGVRYVLELLEVMRYVLQVLEVMFCVLDVALYVLEAMKDVRRVL